MFCGFRDGKGISRIGYLDLDAKNPARILHISEQPVLDIGIPGAFDDNGVVPSAVVRHHDKIYLYYAGYNIQKNVRFSVLGGLAISSDGGSTFQRAKQTPVFERTEHELLFRVPHTVLIENNNWTFWYGGGSNFVQANDYTYPSYDIRMIGSKDGINLEGQGRVILTTSNNEYRIARPYVIKEDNSYKMYYCVATIEKGYRLGYAESKNGINWERKDDLMNIDVSETGWDSEMVGYPSFIANNYGKYLFYNGNNYGREGFGYAEWV